MKISVEDLSSVKKKVVVEIPSEEVQKEIETAYKVFQNKANIQGFRKGKVPRQILEQHYGDHIKGEVTTKLIEDSYPNAVKEKGLKVTARPEIENISDIKQGQVFAYTAVIEVRPDVKVEGYKAIEIKKQDVSVSDNEIDEAVNILKERHANFKDMEGDEAAKDGNLVIIDFSGAVDDKPIKNGKADNYSLVLGSGSLLKEFEHGIVGMKKDEEKSINVKFPEDYMNKELAGKEGVFKVVLKGLKEKILPDLNDEFAKDMGCESLTQLKEKVKSDILKNKERDEKERLRNEIVKELIKKNVFETPKSLVEHYTQYLIGHAVDRFKKGMIAKDEIGLSPEQLKDRYAKTAEELVRRDIIIDAIAKEEGLNISDNEMDAKIKEIAEKTKEPITAFKAQMEKEGSLEYLKEGLLEDKVFDLIISSANNKK
ncbi:MAG: trigger factor [Deltaproteobacteria bacterium]|nr:trigger factor [Deltaproteobacteria bacterium]